MRNWKSAPFGRAKPDWHGEFLQWRNKRERLSLLDVMRLDGIKFSEMLPDSLRVLFGMKRLQWDVSEGVQKKGKRGGKS